MKIALTRGMHALVDDDDAPLLSRHKWSAHRWRHTWYAVRASTAPERASGWPAIVPMHRLLLGMPPARQIDHRNGDGLDNRRVNLRIATAHEQRGNMRQYANNTSGLVGAFLCRDRLHTRKHWRALVQLHDENGHQRSVHCGYYETAEEAHRAHQFVALQIWGPFLRRTDGDLC